MFVPNLNAVVTNCYFGECNNGRIIVFKVSGTSVFPNRNVIGTLN